MSYEQLPDFVQNRIKVSHVYLPALHLALLQGDCRCSIKEIDRSILLHDESQVG